MTQFISNISWQNLNSLRRYPLDDAATCVPDASSGSSAPLPPGVLADLNIWTPYAHNARLFVGSVSVSPMLVTVTICRAVPGSFVPVAAVSVQSPIVAGRNYALKPFEDGIAGWVTFGHGLSEVDAGHWTFSSVAQSGILPRLVRSYAEDGVTSIGRSGRLEGLTGRVKLLSGDTDRLIVECVPATSASAREIDGAPVDAVVIRLNEGGSQGYRVHADFLGPCLRSPESGSCRRPAIFSINGVSPDCDGIIHFVIEELTDEVIGPQLYITSEEGRLTLNFDTPIDVICSRAQAKTEFPLLVDPSCESPCFTGGDRPFAGYVSLYASENYGGSY